jgi:hypothetical protein
MACDIGVGQLEKLDESRVRHTASGWRSRRYRSNRKSIPSCRVGNAIAVFLPLTRGVGTVAEATPSVKFEATLLLVLALEHHLLDLGDGLGGFNPSGRPRCNS